MATDGCISPRIEVRDQEVFWDGKPMGLRRRPLTRRLFEVFAESPQRALDRLELVVSIYGQGKLSSERYRQSMSQNLVKLMSRARRIIRESMESGEGIEWFAYNAATGRWSLYQLKD